MSINGGRIFFDPIVLRFIVFQFFISLLELSRSKAIRRVRLYSKKKKKKIVTHERFPR